MCLLIFTIQQAPHYARKNILPKTKKTEDLKIKITETS
jgi:hypothetical protein